MKEGADLLIKSSSSSSPFFECRARHVIAFNSQDNLRESFTDEDEENRAGRPCLRLTGRR